MAGKTNAIRLAEAAGIALTEMFYHYDENDLDGNHAAHALGLDPWQVFKTLVTKGDRNGIHVFCIPVCCNLDLKKAAKATGNKAIEMVAVRDLLNLTGYIRGGCSPIGMKKKYPTHIHETALLLPQIGVSAGERGHQMLLAAFDLAALIQADFGDYIT